MLALLHVILKKSTPDALKQSKISESGCCFAQNMLWVSAEKVVVV